MKTRLLIVIFCILALQGCTKNQNDRIDDNSKKQQTSETSIKERTSSSKKEKRQADNQLIITQITDDNQNAAQSSIYMSLGDGTASILGYDNHSIQVQYSVPDNQQTIYVYIDQHLITQTNTAEGELTLDIPKKLLDHSSPENSIHVIQFSQFVNDDPSSEEYIDNTLIHFDLVKNDIDKTS